MNDASASPAWFRTHFNEDYLVIYSGRSQEQADQEVDFVIRQLGIRTEETVLDLCCGFGRHLDALRRRDISAVGVDLSPSLLAIARERLRVPLVCADMRMLPFTGGGAGFHALVNFFTSFGYFETARDNIEAAREMARVLRPGGRFSIDLMNREPAIAGLIPRSERRKGEIHIVEERSFNERRSRIEKSIRVTDLRSGVERSYFESVRVYSPAEIRDLLGTAGLAVERLFGSFRGEPFGPESPRMIVTGRRRSP